MNNWISIYSTFLFARASTIEGVARSMDIGATLQEYNNSQSGQEADMRALSADFHAISDDLLRAIAEIAEQEKIQINDEIFAKAQAMLNTPQ
jgi:hypothetical protein